MDYSSGASPVQKVVELMQTMVAEGKKEIQAEKVQYAKYSKWCEMTQAKKSQVISDTADAIDGLKADISKTSATIDRLTAENEGHQSNIAALVAQQENITQIREKENEDFQAILKDYGESISALGNAIGVMKEQAYDRKQAKPEKAKASALLDEFTIQDLRTKAPGREMTTAVTALVESAKKPEVDGYEFQSKGIVELLKELEDKFIQEKADLEKAEFEKKAAYETTLAGLKNEQAAEQKDIGKKSALKSKKLQQKAELGNNLDTSESTKAADEKYLQDITSTCSQKATDYASRQKLRAEELEAVDKAIEIIGGETVAGSEQKHLAKSFLQVSGTSLAALRANDARRTQAVIKEKVAAFLQKEADRLHSATLANLVAPTEESQSLGGVEDMVQELIAKLEKQAAEAKTKQELCDSELKKNERKRGEKSADADQLEADIEKLQVSAKKLKEEAVVLEGDVAELDQSVQEASDLRAKEKAKNNETVTDAQAAQEAVAQATSVLKAFYEKAGQATALVQVGSGKASDMSGQPAIFGTSYNGMSSKSGGVLDMLQVIAADFAKLEAETSSEEESSQAEYDKFIFESKVNKKQMEVDIKHKKEYAAEQLADSEEKTTELGSVQEELKALLQVYEAMNEECTTNRQEAQKTREETIVSLQETLKLLDNITLVNSNSDEAPGFCRMSFAAAVSASADTIKITSSRPAAVAKTLATRSVRAHFALSGSVRSLRQPRELLYCGAEPRLAESIGGHSWMAPAPSPEPVEHPAAQAVWTGATNLSLLPVIFLTYRVDMRFESVVCFFTLVTSATYHVCESLDYKFLGVNHYRWHFMDNIFAITGIMLNIMNFAQGPRPSALREFRMALTIGIVICFQAASPWNLANTVVPLVLSIPMLLMELVYLRRLPTLDKSDALKALLCVPAAALCFYKGLDESKDWLRLWHGGWHLCIGAVTYFSVRCQNPQLRKAAQKTD
ncbi:mkkA [Symbiodinium microadriaticum]|nr:mkkA [Symbiodinium microadriaticum]